MGNWQTYGYPNNLIPYTSKCYYRCSISCDWHPQDMNNATQIMEE